MLVCSRKPGEAVMIGDDIEVVVLAIHEGRVKLGFLAPREVSVHRLEIWKREIERRIAEAKAKGSAYPRLRTPRERQEDDAA